MPKVHDTRKQKAAELLQLATNGPRFDTIVGSTPEYVYHLWSQSWVIPLLRELIPEIRERETNNAERS